MENPRAMFSVWKQENLEVNLLWTLSSKLMCCWSVGDQMTLPYSATLVTSDFRVTSKAGVALVLKVRRTQLAIRLPLAAVFLIWGLKSSLLSMDGITN